MSVSKIVHSHLKNAANITWNENRKNAFYPAVKRNFTLFTAGYKHVFEGIIVAVEESELKKTRTYAIFVTVAEIILCFVPFLIIFAA